MRGPDHPAGAHASRRASGRTDVAPVLESVLDAIARQTDNALPIRLCAGAADLLRTPGVAIALTGDDHYHTVAATAMGHLGERLQIDLGEGPGHDAHRGGSPVIMERLVDDATWPAFSLAALRLGIEAVFSFPLRTGSARVGSFNLYRDAPLALSAKEYQETLVFAMVARELLLSMQAGEELGDLHAAFLDTGHDTWEAHQASGMVSVQLGVSLANALAVLRSHAFAAGQSLNEVSRDVLARRLNFPSPGETWNEPS